MEKCIYDFEEEHCEGVFVRRMFFMIDGEAFWILEVNYH